MVKVGKYDYLRSTRKDKKLMVRVDDRLIHFGNPKYQHYFDRTRIWKELDHNNKERRKNYLTRSAGIKNKEGETKDDKYSPNYHARRILW